ncbi:MAG: hypothetical protein ACE5FF_07775 [Saprospiraceae bacterium]
MKKVFAFMALAMVFAACSNSAKFTDSINELASKWDATTAAVTEFSQTMKDAQSAWVETSNTMQVAPETMANWDETTKNKYNELQAAAQTNTTNLGSIASELEEFMVQWSEQNNTMQDLKDGLASGKLSGDTEAKIAELTSAANNAATMLDGWKTKYQEVASALDNSKQMFTDFMGSIGGDDSSTR